MSTTMVDNYLPREYGQPVPHRKPLPQGAASHVARASNTMPFPSLSPADHHHQSHSRSRTSSSSVFPSLGPGTNTTSTYSMTTGNHTRRTLSNATTSTTASSTSSQHQQHHHHHHHHHPNLTLGRTPSGRSTSQSASPGPPPTSYVALLRKQKATVWCERAQHEDPRLLAAQRAARKRAQLEFAGGLHGHGRTNTSSSNNSGNGGNTSVRSKIRHHGVPKATPYNGGNMAGSGVPLRLSATEIEDEVVSDEEWVGAHGASSHQNHRRTGSGRSSLGSMSGPRISYSGLAGQQGQQYHSQHRVGSGSISGGSAASTPHNRSGEGSPTQLDSASVSEEHLEEATPVPGKRTHGKDYFAASSVTETEKRRSDELRRRGSVDDRTMTMSGNVRLFVANPDLD